VAYNAIHSPMQAPLEHMRRFNGIGDEHRQVFAAMLAAMDDGVGAILARLQERNLEEQTLVVFLSDNGGPTAELTSSNYPLRGGKGQLWEGGIRIPFAVQWKGHIPQGRTLDQPVIAVDIFPTLLAAAGVPPPPELQLDGVNLLPLLAAQTSRPPHVSLFWRYGNAMAIRRDEWKLVRQPPSASVRDAPFGLYRLTEDIGETQDLSSSQPELAESLRSELLRWNAQMADPLW
jgi:arylsulfatase A-like enzyme